MAAAPPRPRRRRACLPVRLAAVSGGVFALSGAAVAVAYAVGGEGAVEDTWLGSALGLVAVVAFTGSLTAFVWALVDGVRYDRVATLWLPLSVFPACVLFLALGEILWWE